MSLKLGKHYSRKTIRKHLSKVMNAKLRKFQVTGVQFLIKRKGVGLIGDDMGVGKTLQVLAFLALFPDYGPIVIECPSNAKYEWEDQLYEHTKFLDCQVLEGRKPYKITSNIIIINYDILPFWEEKLLKIKVQGVTADECHYIKTRKIKRTVTTKKLVKKAKFFIPMSGTPITNRPVEFFPVLNMLDSKKFRSFWKYAWRFCDPKKGFRGRGWVFNGAENLTELHELVKPMMIRRMKSEVLKELPPKQRIRILVEIDNRKEYDKASDDFLAWYQKEHGRKRMKKAKRGEAVVKLGVLKRLAAHGIIKSAIRWIDDYLETTGKKLVVFCHGKDIQEILVKHYGASAAIGGKKGRKRKIEVKKFQTNKKCRVFLGKLMSDKEAITLTAASATFTIELGWNPGLHDQAEDRVNRYGQTASSIEAYYMIAMNTVYESVWEMIEAKRIILSHILDGEEYDKESKKRISINNLMLNWNKRKAPKCEKTKTRKRKKNRKRKLQTS